MNEKNIAKANKKSPTMNYAITLLKQVIEDIKSGKCSEQELTDALSKFHPESNGYFKEEDFVNYDEAGLLLGVRWDRRKLNNLCKEHNIVNQKVNNLHIGFRKKDILRLKQLLEEMN